MSASLSFVQAFKGVSSASNPINSTIDVTAIQNSIKATINSQLTSDVQPIGSSSFYTVPSSITKFKFSTKFN